MNSTRLSPGERERKIRYIEDEFRQGRFPLNSITGLNIRDRLILEQHIRNLQAVERRRRAGKSGKRRRNKSTGSRKKRTLRNKRG